MTVMTGASVIIAEQPSLSADIFFLVQFLGALFAQETSVIFIDVPATKRGGACQIPGVPPGQTPDFTYAGQRM